jgi:hypothetical protein
MTILPTRGLAAGSVPADGSPSTSYRLVGHHCDGTAKNSDEKQVTVRQCKATTEARE